MQALNEVLPRTQISEKTSVTFRVDQEYKDMIHELADAYEMSVVDTFKALVKREYDSLPEA